MIFRSSIFMPDSEESRRISTCKLLLTKPPACVCQFVGICNLQYMCVCLKIFGVFGKAHATCMSKLRHGLKTFNISHYTQADERHINFHNKAQTMFNPIIVFGMPSNCVGHKLFLGHHLTSSQDIDSCSALSHGNDKYIFMYKKICKNSFCPISACCCHLTKHWDLDSHFLNYTKTSALFRCYCVRDILPLLRHRVVYQYIRQTIYNPSFLEFLRQITTLL